MYTNQVIINAIIAEMNKKTKDRGRFYCLDN